jgi:hypothetical protein
MNGFIGWLAERMMDREKLSLHIAIGVNHAGI